MGDRATTTMNKMTAAENPNEKSHTHLCVYGKYAGCKTMHGRNLAVYRYREIVHKSGSSSEHEAIHHQI